MNKRSNEKRARVVAALVEGNPARATIRRTGLPEHDSTLQRSGGASCLSRLKHPQLRRPIRQRHTQSIHIRVARPQQRLALRNLPAATCDGDSCRISPPLPRHLVEGPPVAVEGRLPAREPLPSDYRNVDILRVDVDA